MTDPRDRPDRRSNRLPPELDPRRGRRPDAGRDPGPGRSGSEDELAERFRRGGYPGGPAGRETPARPPRPDRSGGRGGPPPRRTGGSGGPAGSGQPPSGKRRAIRALKVIGVVASVVVLVISGAMWNFYRSFSTQITHIDAVPASSTSDGKDQNILLVGNDSRAGLTDAELKEVGTQADPGLDTDTMLLVHIPADGRQATAVSMPRDSWVNIPGVGMHKLNSAYANGACSAGCGAQLTKAQKSAGARKLIETVQGLSGLHVDHYVEVGLLGFYKITNVLDGVTVCLKEPAKDHYSGIDLPAGVQTIKGTQALAFVRQRHGLPGGDLDRVKRQQAFLSAVADKVLTADTLLKPWKLKPLLDSVAKSLTVDEDFDPVQEIERLRELAAGNVKFATMPVGTGTTMSNGQDALPVDTAKVHRFFADTVKSTTSKQSSAGGTTQKSATPSVPRSSITVQVLNGGTIKGLAAKTNTALQQAGFQTTTPGNMSSGDFSQPEILYASGQADAAHTLAGVVPGAVLKEDDTLGTTLHLIVGDSFGGVRTAGYTVPAAHGGGTGMVADGPITVAAPKSVAAKSGPACVD